ncbi:MAG: hypothetical protein ACYCS4_07910 [Acidimicrobiales bacterium]
MTDADEIAAPPPVYDRNASVGSLRGHAVSTDKLHLPIAHLHGCRLEVFDPDDNPHIPHGHWETCSCEEFQEAVQKAGGLDALEPWSSLTDPDGEYGPPTVFTSWGLGRHLPVVAEAASPQPWRHVPCEMDHARFVVTGPDDG